MNTLQPLFGVEEIRRRIDAMGTEITHAYEGRRPMLLGLLRGCVPFLAELMTHFERPFDLEFAQGCSYVDGTVPSHAPRIDFVGSPRWQGRDVLVVDDILDTGATYATLREQLLAAGAASVKLAVLLDKPSRRLADVTADWAGFEIPDLFVVGFGMDCAGEHRGLPWIGSIAP